MIIPLTNYIILLFFILFSVPAKCEQSFEYSKSNDTSNNNVIVDKDASPSVTVPQKSRKPHGMNQEDLQNESTELGILYSAKAFVQLVTNPFIGPITHR